MNLVPSMKKSFFLPTSLIIERLQHFWTSLERNAFLTRVKELKKLRYALKYSQFAYLNLSSNWSPTLRVSPIPLPHSLHEDMM